MPRFEMRYLRPNGSWHIQELNFLHDYEAQQYVNARRQELIKRLGYDPRVQLLTLEDQDDRLRDSLTGNPIPYGDHP